MIGLRILMVVALSGLSAVAADAAGSTAEPHSQASGLQPASQNASESSRVLSEALGGPEVARLLEEVLRASGMDDPAARLRTETQFADTLARLKRYVKNPRSRYRRALRLHDALHRYLLREYVPMADGLDSILEHGQYNCVSATLFYGIAGRALGLDLRVVETPRHIYLRLEDHGKSIDIESTSPTGFDFTGDLERFRRYSWAYQFTTEEEIEYGAPSMRFERVQEVPVRPVTLEQATAFLWHNTAQKALARGDAVKAADCFAEEFRSYPGLAVRLQAFATSLARAFWIDYEAGRFDSAFRTASVEMKVFPQRTTSRDRMLAAACKRIEIACEAGDPASAETILETAGGLLTVPSDRRLLERETCPHIAAAAVRTTDWDRAHRMAARYASAEPDRVEADRFFAWIETREAGEASDHHDLCPAPVRDRPSGRFNSAPESREGSATDGSVSP